MKSGVDKASPSVHAAPVNVSTREAAELIGVSVSTLHRLVDRGELKPVQQLAGLRGPMLFRRRDVERFAARRAKAARS